MWNPEGKIVQIHIGRDVIRLFTASDDRGLIKRMFGANPPQAGALLPRAYEFQQQFLKNSHNILLPDADYNASAFLPSDHVLVYYGIERRLFAITGINDLLNYLAQKAQEYSSLNSDRQSLISILTESVTVDNLSRPLNSLNACCKAFYVAICCNYDVEAVLSLGYAGNMALLGQDLIDSVQFLVRAANLSLNTNIIDPGLRLSILFDTAIALRSKANAEISQNNLSVAANDLNTAGVCYEKAVGIAKGIHDEARLFCSLCGLAGVKITSGIEHFDVAKGLIDQAYGITNNPEVQRDLSIVRNYITECQYAKEQAISAQLRTRLSQVEEDLARNRIKANLISYILPLILNTSATLVMSGLGLLGDKYNIGNIAAPVVLGRNAKLLL